MTSNWLEAYLVDAVTRKLCTKIGCTTCGAMEFRNGVLSASSRATGEPLRQRYDDQKNNIEIAKALAEINPSGDELFDFEHPVRLLLSDLWGGLPFLDNEIEALLAGSWAGGVLARMKAHHEAKQAKRRVQEELNNPTIIEKRRAEKKRLKQDQHEKRMALKKERDRLWREKNIKAD